MQLESPPVPRQEETFFGSRRGARLALLVLIFLAALALRLVCLTRPPFDYHPSRQYRSALLARSFYLEGTPGIPAWRKAVAADAVQKQWTLEPPILERLASWGYRLLGRESLWLPRLLSSVFWLVGGGFLYRVARRTADTDAAILSTAFYLLLPYAVPASATFQPDPLMVMMLLVSIWTILRWHDRSSKAALTAAAVVSALAVLTKPMCIFPIFASFVSIAVWKHGLRKAILSPGLLVFTGVLVVFSVAYYGYGLFVVGSLRESARMSFIPRLLLSPFFWGRWLQQVLTVLGPAALLGGLIGIQLARRGLSRALLAGLWTGYVVFGLVFNYHTHTHDYYHLQLVPIVALSLGPVCAGILNLARRTNTQWYWRGAAWVVLLVAAASSFVLVYSRLAPGAPDCERQIRTAEEIGEIVGHSTRTIYLNSPTAKPVQYYGEFSGKYYPNPDNLKVMRYQGMKPVTTRERLRGMVEEYSAEYFIAADLGFFRKQPDLRELLTEEFPVVAQSEDFVVFDLRKWRRPEKPAPE